MNRSYLILNVSEVDKVIFNETLTDSKNSVATSLDGLKVLIKWEGETPAFVSNIASAQGPYTHEEILLIIRTPEWFKPMY